MTLNDGTPIWFELVTPDPRTAAALYEAVVGWTTRTSPAPEHGGAGAASGQTSTGEPGRASAAVRLHSALSATLPGATPCRFEPPR